MEFLERATALLQPLLDEERRGRLLTLAFFESQRAIYDAIAQSGATDVFTVDCVRRLLALGCVGGRHALSLLLAVAADEYAGDVRRQAEFTALMRELDAQCCCAETGDAPYRGLQAFGEEDERFFFGREIYTRELLAAVERSALVAVLGASGSGKSSLVQAGLLPALRRQGGWAVLTLRPGAEPWRSLAGCLLAAIDGEAAAGEGVSRLRAIGDLANDLAPEHAAEARAARVGVPHLVDAVLRKRPDCRRLLLVVDQWEELYTYRETSAATAAAFADCLLAATASAPLHVVLTLRADFTGRALEHRPLRDQLQQATVFLGGMTRTEREQAISGPARVAGLRFEAGLVSRLLDDVGDEPGNLPLLEFCLTQLYARRQDATLCQAAYEAIGRVPGAIVTQADRVVEQLASGAASGEALARDVFLQLVQIGEGSADTRRRVSLVAFGAEARALIGKLADARLLVTSRDPGSEDDTVEVAHEALIRNWPRLHDWLRQDRDDLLQWREIGRAAAAWHAHGESYRWPDERVMRECGPMLRRLGTRFALGESERRFLGPLEAGELLARLDDAETPHALRATIGDRLALLPGGDPRDGVGLGADGLPDIVWQAIPGGEVELEVEASGWLRRWRGRPRFAVEPFYLARYPVTVAQWRAFLDAPDGYEKLFRARYGVPPELQRGRDNQPAVNVCWWEAIAYCQWLSDRLGFAVYLPSEWQWQHAATSGEARNEYPWGAWQEGRANTNDSELGRIVAVGLYPLGVSAQGVFDLAGNTWEWCLNAFDTPADVTLEGNARRVVRGGSWDSYRVYARGAFRNHDDPGHRLNALGLRLVCFSPILKR